MEDNTNLYSQRNILIRNFLIFSRLAPFITSFISSVLINKIFLKAPNLINLDFILIFISLYLILYGSFRFILEFFREPDAHLGFIIHVFSLGQLLCIVEIFIGLYLCWLLQKQPTQH